MTDVKVWHVVVIGLCGIAVAGCTATSPAAPSALALSSGESAANALREGPGRPLHGRCATTFTPTDPPAVGACPAFEAVPSAFVSITGQCQVSHLGRTSLTATQQLLFQLDAGGQPVFVNGQPVVTALRNCGVFVAANGDQLRHITSGIVGPGQQPGTVAFDGILTFSGGTGRFAGASGQAAFDGDASLVTNTGAFSMNGAVRY